MMKGIIMKFIQTAKYALMAFVATTIVLQLGATSVSAASLFSASKEEACKGATLDDNPNVAQDCDARSAGTLNNTLSNIINLISIIVSIAAVIMIIIGGFRYIASAGDSGGVSSAKNTIIYAIVGLIVVAMAQIIVRFVLNKSTRT
jgi:uncharacterized membrane protein YuzA (DUF378 family)